VARAGAGLARIQSAISKTRYSARISRPDHDAVIFARLGKFRGRRPPSQEKFGYSVATGSGLAGYKYQPAGGTLSALVGESVKNANDGAISGKNPDRNDGHGSKSHYENNQYATQVQAHFPNLLPPEFRWRDRFLDPLSASSIYPR
jgi:hypothetical protein